MGQAFSGTTILAADIGGTNCRFALFRQEGERGDISSLELVRQVRFPTASCTGSAHMMQLLAAARGEDGGFFTPRSPWPQRVDAAVLAVPGPAPAANMALPPAEDAVCLCPNVPWPMQAAPIRAALDGAPVRFINDFVANGFACALLPERLNAAPVLPGTERPDFPLAVIGAGTGLGHCLILPYSRPIVAGAEAGHTLFPFTPEEETVRRYLANIHGTERIETEKAVAGSALAHIYTCHTGKKAPPGELAALAAATPPVMACIAAFYGRAVFHYILNTLPLGGVFITGGLAANVPGILSHPAFAAEIRQRNPMAAALGDIPISHVRNQDLGLWGAAAAGALPHTPQGPASL